MTSGGVGPILVRVKQTMSRSLRLVSLLLVASLLLSGVALAGLVPAALAASAAARELGGKADPSAGPGPDGGGRLRQPGPGRGGQAAAAAAAGPARAAPLPLLRRRGDPDAAGRPRAGCRPRPGRVGGRDFARSQVNLATEQGGGGFPPGSSFKVCYLVAALEKGIPPSTSFDTASPVTVTAPACPTGYTVHNAEPASAGRLDLARATAQSVNTYYAQLMARVGTPAAIAVARRMGITSPLRDWCSLVLGTENLTPLELARAYATLASGGIHCPPELIARITGPTGRVLFGGGPVYGGTFPALIFHDYMAAALQGQPRRGRHEPTAAPGPGRPGVVAGADRPAAGRRHAGRRGRPPHPRRHPHRREGGPAGRPVPPVPAGRPGRPDHPDRAALRRGGVVLRPGQPGFRRAGGAASGLPHSHVGPLGDAQRVGAGRAVGPTARRVRSRAACRARRVAAGSDRSARAVSTGRMR